MLLARGGPLYAVLLLAVSATHGACQERSLLVARPGPISTVPVDDGPAGGTAAAALGPGLLSLALPGAGQYRLGQSRTWAYLILEVAAWTVHLEERARGLDLRNRYHDLAWTAARVHTTPRREGTWDYYELLIHWTRSGTYDTDATMSGVQPETDPSTYNGWIWSLAKQIYFPPGQTVLAGNPTYQEALAYYEARAYGPDFLWDWSADPGAQVEYARLIDRSDAGFRRATIALGAVFVNHLVSAVDAYVSASGRTRDGGSHVSIEPDVAPGGTRWTARFRIPLPR